MAENDAAPRVLILCRYCETAASSRIRHFAFVPVLQEAGFHVVTHALLDDSQIASAHTGSKRSFTSLLRAYAGRAAQLMGNGSWDVIWIEKEVWPYLPAFIDRLGLLRGRHTILDVDDAWHLRYEDNPRAVVRWLLGRKIVNLANAVDKVTASNMIGADQLRRRGVATPAVIEPYIDADRYVEARANAGRTNSPPVVGWIGSPLTASSYLPLITPVLNSLSAKGMCKVVLVGAGQGAPDLKADRLPWSLDKEASIVAGFDLLVAPLTDGPWEQAKSSYKVLQAFASSVPVVASRVGFTQTLVENGVDGFLVENDPTAWEKALTSLLASAELRDRMGNAGREKAQLSYNFNRAAAAVIDLFEQRVAQA